MFVDELTIYAKAGDGGNGIVSWRQEKYRPKGGPAGGNGGSGGDVYVRGVRDLGRLAKYSGNPKFAAERGGDGRRNSMEGKNGEDFFIDLPVGSVITNTETGERLQVLEQGESHRVLKGGKGGLGNEHFKSSRNTTPYEQTDGTAGEEGTFFIELEMLVDIGLVGLPSAGKSSLVNEITRAKSKVGDYPFTTLEPHLGAFYGYVIADIPGLIEGASEGKGLGHKFLRHIKRTRAIAHLVSMEYEDPMAEYQKIRKELEAYSDELAEKTEIIVLSKIDLAEPEQIEKLKAEFETMGRLVIPLTIYDDRSISSLATEFKKFLQSQ